MCIVTVRHLPSHNSDATTAPLRLAFLSHATQTPGLKAELILGCEAVYKYQCLKIAYYLHLQGVNISRVRSIACDRGVHRQGVGASSEPIGSSGTEMSCFVKVANSSYGCSCRRSCDAVQSSRSLVTFQRNLSPPSSDQQCKRNIRFIRNHARAERVRIVRKTNRQEKEHGHGREGRRQEL